MIIPVTLGIHLRWIRRRRYYFCQIRRTKPLRIESPKAKLYTRAQILKIVMDIDASILDDDPLMSILPDHLTLKPPNIPVTPLLDLPTYTNLR